jgi:hypothetical protein
MNTINIDANKIGYSFHLLLGTRRVFMTQGYYCYTFITTPDIYTAEPVALDGSLLYISRVRDERASIRQGTNNKNAPQ